MRSLQEIYLHILEDKMPSLHLWSDLTAINTKNYYMWQYSAKFCPTIQVILPFATLWQYYLAGWQSSAHYTTYDLSTMDAVSDPEDFYQECWVSLLQEYQKWFEFKFVPISFFPI